MAVSKRKTSKSKNKMRQSGKGLKKKQNIKFNDKGEICISHHVIFLKKKKDKQKEVVVTEK